CTAGPDCNTNGIPDATDIASGTSFDCNANAVPDECETITLWDFNNDSLIDVADHTAFADCIGGPTAGPNGPPECVNMCLDAFDADVSGTIDLKDFGDFGRQF
ncbi:MAG: hypothetical protein ACE5GE_11815, partial [Phycisphaerae bacterium]